MDIDPEMKAFAERADAWFDGDYAAKPLAEQRRIYAEFCRAFGAGLSGIYLSLKVSAYGFNPLADLVALCASTVLIQRPLPNFGGRHVPHEIRADDAFA